MKRHVEVRRGVEVVCRSPGVRDARPSSASVQRQQAVATFAARLALLRSALNRWWADTQEGHTPPEPAAISAVRVLLEEVAEESRALRRSK